MNTLSSTGDSSIVSLAAGSSFGSVCNAAGYAGICERLGLLSAIPVLFRNALRFLQNPPRAWNTERLAVISHVLFQ